MFLLIFLFILLFNFGTAESATYNLADCEYATVNTAVTSTATYGDTVQLPTCTATWSSTLTITKGISLKGNGAGNTVITSSAATGIRFDPDATTITNNDRFEISGFTFLGTSTTIIDLYQDTSTTSAFANAVVMNNVFTQDRFHIKVEGNIWGTFANNTINGGWYIYPYGANADSYTGFYPPSFGSAQQFYFEDNTFNSVGGGSEDFIQSGVGGRWAFRYNTLNDTHMGSPMFDEHGTMPTGNKSLQMAEIYGNIIEAWEDQTLNKWRGGKIIMFNNRVTADGSTPLTAALDETPTPPPIETPYEGYFWNNWNNSSNITLDSSSPPLIQANLTYWNYNASCSGSGDCATGIGCGSSAPTGTCTTGVAYWVTDYPTCSTPPTTMADMRTYTQAGRLYKCTSTNNWALYFTPYTYPHPLRGETYELSVTVVGGGTVNSSQGGIGCTAALSPCLKTYDSGTVLTMTPVQNNGWNTGSWSGTGCGSSITMSEARTCTYTFTEIKLMPW